MNIIEDGFNRLLEEIPALEINVSSALSAVKASWERALMPEKRLAGAARHSIAIYIVGLVGAAYLKGSRSDTELAIMGRLLKHAMAIDAIPSERHVKIEGFVPGGRWDGPAGGPWKRNIKSRWHLSLVHSPRMPGGRWTVSIGDMPCLYGDDPLIVEQDTVALLDGVDQAAANTMLRTSPKSSFSRPR